MMFLSRLLLNPQHRQVQRELSDRYQLHRTLMRAFPDILPEGERVLHRVETALRGGQIVVLVQSHTSPDWAYLLEKPHYLQAPPEIKSIRYSLKEGAELHFRLRANPTIKTSSQRHPQKKTRVPLVHEEKQRAWLARKGEQHGFRILQQRISQPQTYRGRKHGSASIQIFTVQFDGVLQVTDAARFTEALAFGIGPAKSFGCGLLSVAQA